MDLQKQMASSQTIENLAQNKACSCGDGEKNIWTSRASDGSEKQANSCSNCEILKSGPLLVSSKGIGWTSWKRRWFVLSRSSLIFYRNDPNVPFQKGSEANTTLGGIDLNNLGSVIVKADKKLLTVLFPDGRDGRTFTLKAETLEELNEWKTALENALALAPSAVHVMGQNGIFHNEVAESIEALDEQSNFVESTGKDKPLNTPLVVGTPVLLDLESIDGSPSFLEKALRFIEDHGIKVEGILRQSADVEEVVRRVHEYEQGKNEFSVDEDAHVIGDCIKHVLREMPSSPVPASCCTALVDAYRSDGESRIDAMRDAIFDTFPDPNRRLLQRILQMMLTVAAHKAENRMSLSALAACMAPLLLRPLLAGECELKNDFKMDGDGSFQLLQAAAAANHAQAIVIILLEEYEKIFDDDLLEGESLSSEIYTESEDEDIEDEESTDVDIPGDGGYQDAEDHLKANTGDDLDRSYSGTSSESGSDVSSEDGSEVSSYIGSDVGSVAHSDLASDVHSDDGSIVENHVYGDVNSDADPEAVRKLSGYQDDKDHGIACVSAQQELAVENTTTNSNGGSQYLHHDINQKLLTSTDVLLTTNVPFSITCGVQNDGGIENENSNSTFQLSRELCMSIRDTPSPSVLNKAVNTIPSRGTKFTDKSVETQPIMRTKWGRSSARKNLSMESIEYISDDESTIQRLESTKSALQTKITNEIEGNAFLLASLDQRKDASRKRRLALENEVARLQEQLQKERDLRTYLESGMMNMQTAQLSTLPCLDNETRSHIEEIILTERDIINLEENIAELCGQLQQVHATLCGSCGQPIYRRNEPQKSVDNVLSAQKGESASENKNPTVESNSADLRMRNQDLTSFENNPIGHNSKMPMQSSGLFHEDATSRNLKKIEAGQENTGAFVQQPPSLAKDMPSKTLCSKSSTGESSFVLSADAAKSFSSWDENPMIMTENPESMKAQSKNSSGDKQPFHKLLPKLTYQSSGNRSSGITPASSADSRCSSSRKTALGDSMKRDALDFPASARRLSSHKKQPSGSSTEASTSLYEEQIALIRNNATRRHFPKSEEVASSSTLAKLTNRLNFLKERRVQLANELQNLDIGRAP